MGLVARLIYRGGIFGNRVLGTNNRLHSDIRPLAKVLFSHGFHRLPLLGAASTPRPAMMQMPCGSIKMRPSVFSFEPST